MLHLVGPLVVLAYSAWKTSRKKVLRWICPGLDYECTLERLDLLPICYQLVVRPDVILLWKIVNNHVNFHIAMPLKQKCNPPRNSRPDLCEISYSSKWKSIEKFCIRAPWISNVLLQIKSLTSIGRWKNSNMHFLSS